MTEVTINDRLEVLGLPGVEVYNVEVVNARTLTTGFGKIVGVQITPEETQAAANAWGYSLSGGVITFSASGTLTCSVTVWGRR